jgi:hypothetical protein
MKTDEEHKIKIQYINLYINRLYTFVLLIWEKVLLFMRQNCLQTACSSEKKIDFKNSRWLKLLVNAYDNIIVIPHEGFILKFKIAKILSFYSCEFCVMVHILYCSMVNRIL